MHEFKGDEADIVMIVPYSTKPPFESLRSSNQGIQEEERRVWLNAITRARETSILINTPAITNYPNRELIGHFERWISL
jgi:superfamily I DNA/RNA helicase